MSAEPRQSRLAAAKRKLWEYQQQNSLGSPAGARKKGKNKHGSRLKTTTSAGWESLKDAPYGHAPPAETLADDHNTVSPGVLSPNAAPSDASSTASTQNSDAEHGSGFLGESMAVSSTKCLWQLSHQLSELLSESRYQDLALALASSNPTNKQLTSKIEELKQQNQETLDQLEKEKKDHEQKLVREQGSLGEQLQSPIQTVGILVSEKTEVQTALAHAQQAARQKAGESEELAGRLEPTRLRVGEVYKLSAVSTHYRQTDRYKELIRERDALKLQLSKNNKANEDLQQRNSELEERLRLLLKEKDTMQVRLGDLKKKLEIYELLLKQVEEKHRQAEELQQQRDLRLQQYMAVYQQHVATYQQLANKDILQQHKEEQNKMKVVVAHQELQKTQGRLEAASKQNEQLKAQLNLMAQPGAINGLSSEEKEEEADMGPPPKLSNPDDLYSWEAMVALCNEAMAGAKEELARLREQVKKQKVLCQRLAQQAAPSHQEPKKMEAPAPGTGGEHVPGETHQDLQGAMDKLQGRCAELLQEKADLKERVEELEHQCILLSGENDTIGDYIVLYQHQRAAMRAECREKEQHISRLAQEKEEIKVKLSQLQKLLMQVAVERSEWRAKFQAANQNPAAEPTGAPPAPKEPGAAKGQEHSEMSLAAHLRPIQGEAQLGQTPLEIQSPRERITKENSPCVPFFYWTNNMDMAKIMVV